LIASPVMLFSAIVTSRFRPKHVLLFSLVLLVIGSVILPFADSPDKYWSRDFPGMFIGAIGNSLLFVNVNVAFFRNTPPEVAGTIGAIFNSALQLGAAVIAAIATTIQTDIDERSNGNVYAGRAAGFWFMFACVAAQAIAVLFFYHDAPQVDEAKETRSSDSEVEKVADSPRSDSV